MRSIGFRIIWKRLRAIPYFLRDKTVPLWKKAALILALIYVVSPIDLVPLFPFDDIILLVYVLWSLKDQLDKYWVGEKKDDFSKKYSDKDIVEGVKFKVEDDE